MKQPPALDDKLLKNCLEMLKWAPLLFLCNGYWMVSNRQIFRNAASFVANASQDMPSTHFAEWATDHAAPLLLFVLLHVSLIAISLTLGDFLQRWGFTMQEKDILVDEDLPHFFKAVTLSQAN